MKKRAFVRYSKQGKVVPGSLILTSGTYPKGPALWKEVPADLCCESGVKLTFDIPGGLPITTPYVQFFCGLGPTLVAAAIIGTYSTPEALAAALNAQAGFLGEWSVDGTGNIVLAIATDIAETLLNNPECTGVVGTITPFGGPEPEPTTTTTTLEPTTTTTTIEETTTTTTLI